MQLILSIAIIVVLLSCVFILFRFSKTKLSGPTPVNMFAFIAILFTSGLDVGLVMLPLTEFPIYSGEGLAADEPNPYSFANALAVGFGFWGFLIWAFYFVTTFYFCAIEPKLQLFQIPAIKAINNVVIIATCAFTGFIFLSNVPSYIPEVAPAFTYILVAFVVLCAVASSTHVRYVKILSEASTWLFLLLIVVMWLASGSGILGLSGSVANLGEYFTNIPRFILPVSDYHAFYLFWWFSWSIMIGQFVSRFVKEMEVWKLFLALLIFPSIPIGLWFSVLYIYYQQNLEISYFLNIAMVVVGITFVINSLDSLTRLYTDNLGWTVDKLGMTKYFFVHWTLLFGLVLLYQFTPLKIEWIGLAVIAIYTAIYILLVQRRDVLLKQN